MSGVCAEVTKLELLGCIEHHTPRRSAWPTDQALYALQSTADCTHYRLEALQPTQ